MRPGDRGNWVTWEMNRQQGRGPLLVVRQRLLRRRLPTGACLGGLALPQGFQELLRIDTGRDVIRVEFEQLSVALHRLGVLFFERRGVRVGEQVV